MTDAPVSLAALNDPARLAAVRATGLLDSVAEEAFDRLTRLAVRLVGVPSAFVSLVDEDRDFYKSACGFGEPLATARELTGPTFCHYTVQRPQPLVIPDTAADPVYREVPTVRTLGVAAYVGVPLIVGGQAIGAFCAIDVKPRAWSAEDVETLSELAKSAEREIELRMAVLAAEAATAAKGSFLATMSHELRTPLNAIGGYTDLVLFGIHGPVTEAQREALTRVQGAQRRLLGIINDILNFAKLESGKVAYDIAVVSIGDVLAEVVPLLEPQLAARGVALDLRIPRETCLVMADREKVGQILLNLLSNAAKFTDPVNEATGEPGCVTVSVESREGAAPGTTFVRIADNGRGIPDDRLTAVFDPFVQVNTAYARPGDGTGLGLAISRDLAKGMGGELRARSVLGEGSAFTLTLPGCLPEG